MGIILCINNFAIIIIIIGNYSNKPSQFHPSVSGISTTNTIALPRSNLWNDRPYVITDMSGDLAGSILFQLEHYVAQESTILVSSDQEAYIRVALYEEGGRDGGLMEVLSTEGWSLKEGWYVEWSNQNKLNKIWSKQIEARELVNFTTTMNRGTFAIFASEGINFI